LLFVCYIGYLTCTSCLQLLHIVVLMHILLHVRLPFSGNDSKGMWAWLATNLPLPTCALLFLGTQHAFSPLYMIVTSTEMFPLATCRWSRPLLTAFSWWMTAGRMPPCRACEIFLLFSHKTNVLILIASARKSSGRSFNSLIQAF
jgi:hypothetical protein